ncbi:hypothetical protein [Labedaea rhizosphaerae]|uniref:hypothetical protein n=1 Tax=Labedaea rhizosphaerae TaxID=598644 RepID=UPI00105F5E9D|nr:hypothetical protein [Labedaea rhizosphaerae]
MSRWPHIQRYLRDHSRPDFIGWYFATGRITLPNPDVAAANEEWADFYEWRLEQRAEELAADRIKRHLVEEWTAGMAYCCRRSAAWARGEEPGEWLPLSERRPDIHAEGEAIVAEIVARLDRPAGRLLPMG